jgi:hypothetical protein
MTPGTAQTRPTLRLLATALIAAGLSCTVSVPVLLPPPFGPSTPPDPARLFFPTGIAAAPSGHLLVNNANFDRQFDSGTMIALSPDYLNAQYAGDPSKTLIPGQLPPGSVTGAVMVASFAGPLALDQTGTLAFTGSRGSNLVSSVQLDPTTGALTCGAGAQYLTPFDCRTGLFDSTAAINPATGTAVNLEGPYGFAAGVAHLPGDPADHPVMFVSSLVPHIDSIVSGTLETYGRVAAVDLTAIPNLLYEVDVSSPILLNGMGSGPLIFDGAHRQIILGGCYQRFGSGSAGEPATAKCILTGQTNPIRFVDVDSGPDAVVRSFDLFPVLRGNETTALVLGAEDATGAPQILYALSRNPDVLVEIELPKVVADDPVARRITPLPLQPAGAIRLQRPAAIPGPDLIAVAGSGNSSISIYSAGAEDVVAQLNISQSINAAADFPFALAQLPVQPADTTARFVVSIFGTCQLAFVDVDFAQPANARLRSVVGQCGK